MSEEKEQFYEDDRHEIIQLKAAFLIGCYQRTSKKIVCQDYLDELEALAHTYGFDRIFQELCPIRTIDPRTYLGKGKVAQLVEKVEEWGGDVIVFDDELTPNQQRNLERLFKRAVIDRTELILEIFSRRAQTKEAKLQIELAKSHYQLPRLKRLWTHLSRQTSGGKGFLKGAGERQIEIDRRLTRKRIDQLKGEIERVKRDREVQRRARVRSGIPTFGIIGYTNVGKSTLLNALTEAEVLVEDRLFATLDTTTRKFKLPDRQEILLVDTVGFIRKIPHTLVAAFKSTLEEARYTDVLLHLIDLHHPLALEQAESTYLILEELGIKDKPIITLLNKIDLVQNEEVIAGFKLKYPNVVAISAKTHVGFEELLKAMTQTLKQLRVVVNLRIPQKEYALVSEILEQGQMIDREYDENDLLLKVEIPTSFENRIKSFLVK